MLSIDLLTRCPFISYKFHRLFPLSQYDLPSHNSKILSFPRPLLAERASSTNMSARDSTTSAHDLSTPTDEKPDLVPPKITQEQISENNPDVDYTRFAASSCIMRNQTDSPNGYQARLDIPRVLGCGQFNAGRREPISRRHVRWVMSESIYVSIDNGIRII